MNRTDVLLSFGLLAGIGLASALAIRPSLAARSALNSEIAQLEAELAAPGDGPEIVLKLSNDLESLRNFGAGRMTPIPAESDIAGLMSSLSDSLSALGLDERDITTRPPKQGPDATSLPVTITLTGPFLKVYDAVSAIEGLPRLVRVERMRLQIEQATGQARHRPREPLVRAEVLIDALHAPVASASATPEGSPP